MMTSGGFRSGLSSRSRRTEDLISRFCMRLPDDARWRLNRDVSAATDRGKKTFSTEPPGAAPRFKCTRDVPALTLNWGRVGEEEVVGAVVRLRCGRPRTVWL